MVLSSHMGGINFADPASIRKAHKYLMTQVRPEAIHIGNEYKIQIEPLQLEVPSSFGKNMSLKY